MKQEFNIGISPCPNDTYIFYALINKKIDLSGYKFNFIFRDVEQLNRLALEKELDICKLSYHAFAKVSFMYQLLRSGGAFGINKGPILVSKTKIYPDEIPYLKIAVPGLNTTAMMLLKLSYPDIVTPEEFVFNEIEEAVLSNQCDAGLLIHESRFTYRQKGLTKIIDLGELWGKDYGLPVPLGGIAIKREVKCSVKSDINQLIKRSIEYANINNKEVLEFAKQYANEMETDIMKKHIDLYVNSFSNDVGTDGEKAVITLFEMAKINNIVTDFENPLFID
jgi:1,4-dihydroxy-6-naphthoate synthase